MNSDKLLKEILSVTEDDTANPEARLHQIRVWIRQALATQIERCLQSHPEGGQCELRSEHKGKHLAGMIMWRS
jgi:hypothetical protein